MAVSPHAVGSAAHRMPRASDILLKGEPMTNRRVRMRAIALLSAISGALAAGSGEAQTAAAQPTLTENIVTAQKRAQNIQDVPIAVIALSAQQWKDGGVNDIKTLQALTPSLTVTSTTSENVTTARIRGIGTVGDNPGLESSVGIVLDGVYRPRNGVGFGDLAEIEQIEILEGPQAAIDDLWRHRGTHRRKLQ